MTRRQDPVQPVEPALYHIAIDGRLPGQWPAFFESFHVETRLVGGRVQTILTGPIADQTGLHGILATIRDLNLPLLAVYSDQFFNPILKT